MSTYVGSETYFEPWLYLTSICLSLFSVVPILPQATNTDKKRGEEEEEEVT